MLKKHVHEKPEGSQAVLSWLDMALEDNYANLDMTVQAIDRIKASTTPKALRAHFTWFVGNRVSFYENRLMQVLTTAVPGTSPEVMKTHDPIDRTCAQIAIDKHALLTRVIKHTYKALLKSDPRGAEEAIAILGSNSVLRKYLTGAIKTIPDPDNAVNMEAKRDDLPLNKVLVLPEAPQQPGGVTTSLAGNPTRDRLQKELAQRCSGQSPQSESSLQAHNTASVSSPKRPGPHTVALIKEDIAQKKRDISELAQEKVRQLTRLKEEILGSSTPSKTLADTRIDTPILSVQDTWAAPTISVKEKTKGIADLSRQQKKKRVQAKRALKRDADSEIGTLGAPKRSSQSQESAQIKTGVYKWLVDFWSAKAGLIYHEVEILFKGFGGEIIEKSGASSHVTLVDYVEGKLALKLELWRPHGGSNTFGFQTVASLHADFEQCGLMLPSK